MTWTTKSLAEVCDVVTDGSHFSPPTTDQGYPYITVRDVRDDEIDFDNCARVSQESFLDLKRNGCAPKKGDVLFSKDGTVGKVALVKSSADFVVLSSLAILRPKAEAVDPAFLAYVMRSPAFLRQAIGSKTGAAIRRIILKNLKKIPVSFPPLAEQKRIVAILDEAFEGIAKATANAERNLANAREASATVLDKLLRRSEGTRFLALDQTVADDCSLSYGIVQPGDELAEGLPIVRPTDIGDRTVGLNGLKRIAADRAAGYKRTTLAGNDLLLCVRGTTGVLSQASPELAGANVTRGIVPIRFNPSILNQNLGYFVLLSDGVQRQIRKATYGAALMQINIRDLRKVILSVPPVDQQSQLLDRLEDVYGNAAHLGTNYAVQLKLLAALKGSILQKAFSGRLSGTEAIAA